MVTMRFVPWKIALCRIVSIGCCLFTAGAGPLPPLVRTVSSSRQFIVYGTDAPVRGAVCAAGERMKTLLLGLLQQPDQWKTPILVNAQYSQANLPETPRLALYFNQTGAGIKLQLDLLIGTEFNAPEVERELLRVVMLELMYRTRPNLPAGTTFVHPPDWLLDGVLATGTEDPKGFDAILQKLVVAKKIASLEQFLSQRPELLDSPSRQLFSAYSFALTSLLTAGPEGRVRLARYIADLPDSPNDTAADLRSHFPVLGNSPQTAEKAWLARLAAQTASSPFQSLSVAETERQLDALLQLRFAEIESCRLEEYPRFLRLPSRAPVLNQLSADLMLLGTRANALYRPIVFEYQEIASALARKKTRRMSRRLQQLSEMRRETGVRMEKIDDYLNWFEATQAQTRSGTFAEYLKAAGKSEDAELHRRDPISVYLNVLEAQFQ